MAKEPSPGQKIRAARLERGVSVADLARLSKINEVTIYRCESGERKPRASTLTRLIKALAKLPKLPEL